MTTIFEHTDPLGDTLEVTLHYSKVWQQEIVEFRVDKQPSWLTPAESKRLRKALKQWERSVAEAKA